MEHEIRLKPGATPAWSRPRRLSPAERTEVATEIEGLLKQGLIEPSTSPWAAAIVWVRRKNGRLRLAMDYRALNDRTVEQHHPLPLIDDQVERLTEARVFSTLDLKVGYHQMPFREEDCEFTGFVTRMGSTNGQGGAHHLH